MSDIRINCRGFSFEQRVAIRNLERFLDQHLFSEYDDVTIPAVIPDSIKEHLEKITDAYDLAHWAAHVNHSYQNVYEFTFYRAGFSPLEDFL